MDAIMPRFGAIRQANPLVRSPKFSDDPVMSQHPKLTTALRRSLRLRCPNCGRGKIYGPRRRFLDRCPVCSLEYLRRFDDGFAVIYGGAAALTGLFAAGFYFGSIWDRGWSIRVLYFLLGVAVMAGSISLRTSVAVGFDYYIRTISDDLSAPIPPVSPEDDAETHP